MNGLELFSPCAIVYVYAFNYMYNPGKYKPFYYAKGFVRLNKEEKEKEKII